MNTIAKKGLTEPASPWAYITSAVVAAAMWAMPVTEGNVHNMASWIVWATAWFCVVGLTLAMFAPPIDKITVSPKPWTVVSSAASWGGVLWLAYHGHVALPSMLAYVFVMTHLHRKRAIDAHSGP